MATAERDLPKAQHSADSSRPTASGAASIADLLILAARLIKGLLGAGSETNHTRFAALRAVRDAGPGGCTQTQLAALLGQSESAVSGLISRMRKSGLLYRLRPKRDRRRRVLMLSERGRRLVEDVAGQRDRELNALMAELTPERQEALAHALHELVAVLSRAVPSVADRASSANGSAGESRPAA